MQIFTSSLSRLSLNRFRNHGDLQLDLSPDSVILTGANGSGKTNLLEAVSLLVPGRGLRRAAMPDLQQHRVIGEDAYRSPAPLAHVITSGAPSQSRLAGWSGDRPNDPRHVTKQLAEHLAEHVPEHEPPNNRHVADHHRPAPPDLPPYGSSPAPLAAPSVYTELARHAPDAWAVSAELQTPTGPLRIGTGRDPESTDTERRVVQIDGKIVRGQQALSQYVAMAWITPEMDRILAEGPSPRRKLLDRLVYSFDPAHGGRVSRYEKALRERQRLLREGVRDAAWLGGLEDEMAQTGVAIAAARLQLLRQLRTAIAQTDSIFPRADYALKGLAEEALEEKPALLVEDQLRAALARTRGDDAQSGTCAVGPHRSDLLVTHRAKNCPADLCSTGEQKALLIATMMAYVRVLTRHRDMTPLFLLDDIAAHLDERRRLALFEELRALKVQAWLTGTDREPFAGLSPYAQHFSVEHGRVHPA